MDLPREAIGPKRFNYFSREVHISISKEHITTCDFSGGWGFRTPCPPLDPPMHMHTEKTIN